MIRLAAICLLPLLLLCSCEQTVDVDTPFVERLVVNGNLIEGLPIRVSISRTIPLDRPGTRKDGWIGDVDASIVIEYPTGDTQRIPLVYSGDSSIYTPATPLTAGAGSRVRLEATWRSSRVTAATTIPYPVPIDSLWLVPEADPYDGDSSYSFVARFRPVGNQVYRLTYGFKKTSGGSSARFMVRGKAARPADVTAAGHIDLRLETRLEYSFQPPHILEAVLYSFDAPYYDFYQSYYLDNEGDGAFSGGSDLTRWNVEGDGIGLFIGQAVSARPVQ